MNLLSCSIVVAAKMHNPSIINPDFLARRGIVPDSWGWNVEGEAITTPPLSQVIYDVGVRLVCEPNKLQFVDNRREVSVEDSRVADIATAYVDTLPHIPYRAVGINFTLGVPVDDPKGFIHRRFVKPGPLNSEQYPLEALGLRLVYSLEDARLRASIDVGEVPKAGGQTHPCVLLDANFHHEGKTGWEADEVKTCIHLLRRHWGELEALAKDFFGPEV